MRSYVPVAWLFGALWGCGDTNPGPSLTIDPSGNVQITGPTDFTATLVNSNADVSWMVMGGGALSTMNGLHVVFTPPTGSGSETLTAKTADGLEASVTISSGPLVLTGSTIPGLTAPVTVQYDAEDIPHINCATTIDCLAVQGYIQARDRFFPMDFLRHVARAHLSEMIGIAGLEQDVQLRTLFVTRKGHRLEDDLVAVMDAPTTALLQAFANGINAYLTDLKSHPGNMPGEYAQLPFALTPDDIAPWTLQDTLAMARLQQFQLSETIEEETGFGQFAQVYGAGPLADGGKITTWIRAAAPTTEQAHTLADGPFMGKPAASRSPKFDLAPWQGVLAATTARFNALRNQLRPAGASVGSNNWVVSGAMSANHASMVANDPHLSLQYPPLFHLSVMTSANAADNLNLAGGAFPGIPGALVGRGANVGWGVTVVGYDVTDVYLEQLVPQASCPGGAAGPPCVSFNGGVVSLVVAPQTYKIRTGPGDSFIDSSALGASAPPPFVLIVPHHGPIIQAPDAGGKAASVRWTGQEGNTQDVKAILGLNTAKSVDDAIIALKNFATGAQNFVLADDQGHIAYDPHALVPVRRWTTTAAAAIAPPWFPLPGTGATTAGPIDVEWGDGTSDCKAAELTPLPASCWIADSALPQGKDPAKGYFFTANADPTATGVSDDNNPLGHPPYLSFDWDDSTGFRATRIDELLSQAIAANGSVSLTDMEAIQADHVSRPGKVFTDIIAALPTTANDPPDLVAARAVLATWATNGWDCPSGLTGTDPVESPVDTNATTVANSSGCFLFHEFLRILLTNVFSDDLAVAGQGVNGLQALKGIIYMLQPGTPAGDKKFCNDVDASGTQTVAHTCPEQVVTALVTAYDTLTASLGTPDKWVWGRVHTIQPVSLLQLVTTNYSPGPYARPGGAFTVDVGSPSLSASGGLDFGYAAGGNVRHISVMNPAEPIVEMQLPGPERDTPALFVGPDLLGQWVNNTYFDFAFGDQINSKAVSTQSFTAQ